MACPNRIAMNAIVFRLLFQSLLWIGIRSTTTTNTTTCTMRHSVGYKQISIAVSIQQFNELRDNRMCHYWIRTRNIQLCVHNITWVLSSAIFNIDIRSHRTFTVKLSWSQNITLRKIFFCRRKQRAQCVLESRIENLIWYKITRNRHQIE